ANARGVSVLDSVEGLAAADVFGHGDGVSQAVDDVAGARALVTLEPVVVGRSAGGRAGGRAAAGTHRQGAGRTGANFIAELGAVWGLGAVCENGDVDVSDRHVVAVAVAVGVAPRLRPSRVARAEVLGDDVLRCQVVRGRVVRLGQVAELDVDVVVFHERQNPG